MMMDSSREKEQIEDAGKKTHGRTDVPVKVLENKEILRGQDLLCPSHRRAQRAGVQTKQACGLGIRSWRSLSSVFSVE